MIRLDDLVTATGARFVSAGAAGPVTGFCFDSRLAEPGELFVAVVTDTGDGHDHIGDALSRGVAGVICQTLPEEALDPQVAWLVVDDTRQALLDYAAWVLADRRIQVVGITGSVGKTGTKEAVAAVLGRREPVFRNPGSYNGRYGLPIALGRLGDERLAVLEMASDSVDEIRDLAALAAPTVGVVTRVGHSHLADLGTLSGVALEKGRLVESLPPHGLAVLNGDDPHVRAMAGRTPARVRTIGLGPGCDLWAGAVETGLAGTRCTVHDGARTVTLAMPWLGAHHAYTMLVAYAVGSEYGLAPAEIARALESLDPLPGRLRPLDGAGGSLLLDDTFSASPESWEAALATLAVLPARRRWVIMGDMADLGPQALPMHRALGTQVAAVADRLVGRGDLSALAVEEALRVGMTPDAARASYSDAEVLAAVRPELAEGDVVLLKGGAAARMERVTAGLLGHSEGAAAVLPRQNPGWRAVAIHRQGRPTWVEVDLAAIAGNTRLLAERLSPGTQIMAVLKADAYGHGARRVARTVIQSGATWLGVATLGEAIDLRQAGVDVPILNLGYTPPWQARDAVRHNVASTVFSMDVAQALGRAGRDLGRPAAVHVKADTGMGRLGLLPDEVVPFVEAIFGIAGLDVQGLFSHLAAADEEDQGYTDLQLAAFGGLVAALRARGRLPRLVHVANSAATLRRPEAHYDLVRVGILLYGLAPSMDTPLPEGFRPALAFKCQVAQVKLLPAGSAVGYGCAFRTGGPTRIAVIPVGYADGFRRGPRNWGRVLVRGEFAPLVGRVCMDQAMVDVTAIPGVRQGDEVVLIGRQGSASLSAEDVAAELGTINYEVISEILARVPRVV